MQVRRVAREATLLTLRAVSDTSDDYPPEAPGSLGRSTLPPGLNRATMPPPTWDVGGGHQARASSIPPSRDLRAGRHRAPGGSNTL